MDKIIGNIKDPLITFKTQVEVGSIRARLVALSLAIIKSVTTTKAATTSEVVYQRFPLVELIFEIWGPNLL